MAEVGCSVCGSTPTQRYSVDVGIRRATAALCARHSAALDDFLSAHEIVRDKGVNITGIRETSEYYEFFATMGEVEADKLRYLANKKRPPTGEP